MEKSKCKAKAAALLMALVILFIPFGSAFAVGRPDVYHLSVDDGFKGTTGYTALRGYKNHMGTYYVRQGFDYAFISGDFVNVGSSFTLHLEVIDYDSGRTIRKVSSPVTVPSYLGEMKVQYLCNLGTRDNGSSYCSKEMVQALDLRTLPAGNYGFAFYVNQKGYGSVVYVKVYSGDVEDFVMSANSTFKLRKSLEDYDVDMYKLTKHQIKGSDYLWNMYYQNQSSGALKGASSRETIRLVCKAAFGRYPTTSEENTFMRYCAVMGVPLTVKRIIYSGKCQSHLIDLGIMP